MTSRGTSTRYTVGDLLLGRERSRTRRALALAVGYFVVASALAVTLRSLRYGAVPEFVYRFQHPFLIDTGFGQLVDTDFAPGLVVVVGPAAVHAYLNAGYLPSLLLATAPIGASALAPTSVSTHRRAGAPRTQ